MSSVTVTPDPATAGQDDLTCDAVATDADGDAILYTYEWSDSSGVQQTMTEVSDVSDTFLAAGLAEDTWTCDVTPYDGTDYGSALSDSVTVESGCSSLSFDGVDDYVEMLHSSALSITGDFTIELWTQNNGFDNEVLFSKNDGFSTGYHLRFNYYANNISQPMIRWGHDYAQAANYDYSYNGTSWIHLAVVGNTSLGTTSIWINGTEVSSGPYGTAATSSNLRFGMDLFRGDGFLDGKISSARMSDSVRYTNTFTPPTTFTNDGNTIANWDFSSGASSIIDLSGNGHHGTINGATWVNTCPEEDLDGDGVAAWEDCDDGDASIYPFAGDTYGDGIDSDCDGLDCRTFSNNGIYYVICPSNVTRSVAVSECQQAGYDGLVSILSASEHNVLKTELEAMPSGSMQVPLGGNSAAWIGLTEPTLQWDSGLPYSYNGMSSGGDDNGMMYWRLIKSSNQYWTWNDTEDPNIMIPFICEKR